MRPELGDTVLYEPPEDNEEQHTMVGTVIAIEQIGDNPLVESSFKLKLFIMRRNGHTVIADPIGYDRDPKPDHWRWRKGRPYA